MKKGLVLALLALGLIAAPTIAKEKVVWFDTYDLNHDGLWDYNEFASANEHYIVAHPQTVKVTTKELHRQFDDWDMDHTGTVKVEQVRTYHDWD